MKPCFDAFKTSALVAGCFLSLLITGCAGISGIGVPIGSAQPEGVLSGKSYGAFNPISGATVSLYSAGTAYGSGTFVANATALTDSNGSFNFASFTCPSADTQMYLVSRGGNTTGSGGSSGNNAAVLITALGPCSSSTSQYITINEVSTVAMVWSMQQFMNVTSGSVGLGAPATMAQGLVNAYSTFTKLANPQKGTIIQSYNPGGSFSGVTMTVTPESGKMTELANLLANCVNQTDATGAPCTTLFTDAVSPQYPTTQQPAVSPANSEAVDTTMAAYYLAINPTQSQDGVTTRISDLHSSASGYTPFGTSLSAAPSDWTLDIIYSAGSTTCSIGAGNTPAPFVFPGRIAIDGNGSVWMNNSSANVGATAGTGTVVELTTSGALAVCAGGNYTYGGAINVDYANNIWFAVEGSTAVTPEGNAIYEIPPGASTPQSVALTDPAFQPFQLTTLKNGDMIATSYNSYAPPTGTSGYQMRYYPGATTTGSSVTASSTMFASVPGGRLFDLVLLYPSTSTTYPTLYLPGSTSIYSSVYSSSSSQYSYTSSNTIGSTYYKTCSTTSSPGAAADLNANLMGVNCSGSSTASPASTWYQAAIGSTTPTLSAAYLGGLNVGSNPSVDGLNNYWAGSKVPVATGTYAFFEVQPSLTVALSPATPSAFTTSPTCTTTACLTGGGFKHSNITAPIVDTAVDESGNVWGLMSSTTAANNGLVQLVGAATPVLTPLVNQLP